MKIFLGHIKKLFFPDCLLIFQNDPYLEYCLKNIIALDNKQKITIESRKFLTVNKNGVFEIRNDITVDLYRYELKQFTSNLALRQKLKDLGDIPFLKTIVFETYGYINTDDEIFNYLVKTIMTKREDEFTDFEKFLKHRYRSKFYDMLYDYLEKDKPSLQELFKLPFFDYIGTYKITKSTMERV